MEGDAAKSAARFIRGRPSSATREASCTGATLEEYAAECEGAVSEAGPCEWRIERLSFEGDTALVRLGSQYAGVWYSDDLSLVWTDDAWRIVHKTLYAHPAG
jgi:hypothetical protein